jgi:hypothetical protein
MSLSHGTWRSARQTTYRTILRLGRWARVQSDPARSRLGRWAFRFRAGGNGKMTEIRGASRSRRLASWVCRTNGGRGHETGHRLRSAPNQPRPLPGAIPGDEPPLPCLLGAAGPLRCSHVLPPPELRLREHYYCNTLSLKICCYY